MRFATVVFLAVALPGCVSLTKDNRGGSAPEAQVAPGRDAQVDDVTQIDQQGVMNAAAGEAAVMKIEQAFEAKPQNGSPAAEAQTAATEDVTSIDQQGAVNAAVGEATGVSIQSSNYLSWTLVVLLVGLMGLMAWIVFLSHRREMRRLASKS